MGLSKNTKKAIKKAAKEKKRRRGSWLFIEYGDSIKEILSKLITQFAVLVLIACGVIALNELRLYLNTLQLNNSLKDIYHTYISDEYIEGELLPSAKQLLEINEDTVGFVSIEGMDNINLPVVQRKTTDGNSYYLKTAFDGSANKAGTIFLDYRATLGYKKRSDVLTIYGHNQKDKTMFGTLKYYKNNLDFYKEHPTITFSSNYQTDTYKIFACFVTEVNSSQVEDGNVFYYHNYIDLDKSSYKEFISNIEERTQIITPVDVEYGDEFLTLSTCSNEFEPSRFVVFARKTRKGEDPSVDTSTAYVNENAKSPDLTYIYTHS